MFAIPNISTQALSLIAANGVLIATNVSNINTSWSGIASNASDIDTNAAAIAAKGFVNNLDINEFAFGAGDLTKDDAWHELDFSSKVPAGAKSIRIRIAAQCTSANGVFSFRVKGESYEFNMYRGWIQLADIRRDKVFDIPVAADRIIEYRISNLTWTTANISVVGWDL